VVGNHIGDSSFRIDMTRQLSYAEKINYYRRYLESGKKWGMVSKLAIEAGISQPGMGKILTIQMPRDEKKLRAWGTNE